MDKVVAAALVIAIVVGGLAMASTAFQLHPFFDPCHFWGADESGQARADPSSDCARVTLHSETRGEAALRISLVQGSALVAAGLGVIGSLRRKVVPLFAAGFLFFAVSVALLLSGLWILTVAAALASFSAAWRCRAPGQPDLEEV